MILFLRQNFQALFDSWTKSYLPHHLKQDDYCLFCLFSLSFFLLFPSPLLLPLEGSVLYFSGQPQGPVLQCSSWIIVPSSWVAHVNHHSQLISFYLLLSKQKFLMVVCCILTKGLWESAEDTQLYCSLMWGCTTPGRSSPFRELLALAISDSRSPTQVSESQPIT